MYIYIYIYMCLSTVWYDLALCSEWLRVMPSLGPPYVPLLEHYAQSSY